MKLIIDAGPALNFLAVGQQNILIQASAHHTLQLAAPERVDAEVEGKCRDERFRRTGALGTWRTLRVAGRIEILSDAIESDQVLAAAVTRVAGQPASERMRERRSLGEILAIAHASGLAQQGHHVVLLIDDSDGRRRSKDEIAYLQHNTAPGSITLWGTPGVLGMAGAHQGWILADRTPEQAYDQMRAFDDGLPDRNGRLLPRPSAEA
nr:hypothetical protein [Actinomycetales bacterium]